MANAILRMPDVSARVGLKRSQIYDLIQRNEFPTPVALGKRARGWLQTDIDHWIEEREKVPLGGAQSCVGAH